MNDAEIKKVILSLLQTIAPDSDPEKLNDNDDIRKETGIDSFDTLQFITGIYKKLGVNIPEEDYGKITTLTKLIEYIKSSGNLPAKLN
jgi:acyl carrier protein